MSEENRKELEILWTPQQMAKYLNVSQVTVYRWLMENRVLDPKKIIRFSNRVRIPRSEVERIAGVFKKTIQERADVPTSKELETNK